MEQRQRGSNRELARTRFEEIQINPPPGPLGRRGKNLDELQEVRSGFQFNSFAPFGNWDGLGEYPHRFHRTNPPATTRANHPGQRRSLVTGK
jgi:hypothetical protein